MDEMLRSKAFEKRRIQTMSDKNKVFYLFVAGKNDYLFHEFSMLHGKMCKF